MHTAETPGLIQPISGYLSCRHTPLLEGNLTIGKAFVPTCLRQQLQLNPGKIMPEFIYICSYVCDKNSWHRHSYMVSLNDHKLNI